jgi:hypothetical protein
MGHQNRTGRKGHEEQDRQNRTGRIGQAVQERHNKTARTGLRGQDFEDRTARTGLLGKDLPGKGLSGNCLPEQGCQERATLTGLPGEAAKKGLIG